jgi:regulatory protein
MKNSVVTSLQAQKGKRDRINVFLDGEFAFAVSLMEAANLYKGQQLRREGEIHLAYVQSLRYLGYRPRSEAEVRRYLGEKGALPDVVDTVVERLTKAQYLNDEEFARYWVENRTRFRPRGVRALRYELRQKGLASEEIESAVEAQDEDAAAWSAIEGRIERWRGLDRMELRQKVAAFLSRRGFGYDVCKRAAERAWQSLYDDAPNGEDMDDDAADDAADEPMDR